MTDAAPREPSIADLSKLRADFVASTLDPAKAHLAAIDEQIRQAQLKEIKARDEAALQGLLPKGADKSALAGHDVVFYINDTKEAGRGKDSIPGAATAAAYKINKILAVNEEKGMTVAAHFWGGRHTGKFDVNNKFGADAYNSSGVKDQHDFLPAAKRILTDSTPDQQAAGRETNYIVVSNGKINDDVAAAAAVLQAAQSLNPKATLDFIVVGDAGKTAVEELAAKLGRKATVTKVATPAEVSGAVVKALKARLAPQDGLKLTKTAPASKPAV